MSEVVKVLAAKGKRVMSEHHKRIVRHVVQMNKSKASFAVWIGDDGLYDGRNPERPLRPGPVPIELSPRYKQLIADGDLIVVPDEAPKPDAAKKRASKE